MSTTTQSQGQDKASTPTKRRGNARERNGPLFWIGMIILAAIFIVPILFMYVTAFRSQAETRQVPLNLIPDEFTLQAFRVIFSDATNPVLIWALNSLLAATLHSIIVLVVASMAAYALARMPFKGRGVMFGVIIATLFVPGFIFLMPNYLLMNQLGWLDTVLALAVPTAAGAFSVFFLRQFFLALPIALEESARIDGANTWQILTRIILPVSRSALITLGTLSFLGNWNEFVWPVFVLFSPERLTLPAGLSSLNGAFDANYPVVMAGATIASVPVLILYIFVQRYIIEGVASSGIKG
ncbi:MAG TPA: carbohydrate ABC transporter permease [Propionibacteriaceae bacterium]|nr:carbohydrate ABC transporter permease [Propionibacteriaceae bacterium]